MVEPNDGAAEARARIAELIPEERRLLRRECAVGAILVAVYLVFSALCVWGAWKLLSTPPTPGEGPAAEFLRAAGGVILALYGLACLLPFLVPPKTPPGPYLEVDEDHHPELYRLVHLVAARLKIEPPRAIWVSGRSADILSGPSGSPLRLLRRPDQRLWIGGGVLSSVNVGELEALIADSMLWWDESRDQPDRRLYTLVHATRFALSGYEFQEHGWYATLSQKKGPLYSLLALLVWCLFPLLLLRWVLAWITVLAMSSLPLHVKKTELLLGLHFGSDVALSALRGKRSAEPAQEKIVELMRIAGARRIFPPDIYPALEEAAARIKLAAEREPDPPAWEKAERPSWLPWTPVAYDPPVSGTELRTLRIPGEIDARSPWSLLERPDEVRTLFTKHLHDAVEAMDPADTVCSPLLGHLFLRGELQDDRDADFFGDHFDPWLIHFRVKRSIRAWSSGDEVSTDSELNPVTLLDELRAWSKVAKGRAEDQVRLAGYEAHTTRIPTTIRYDGETYPRSRLAEIVSLAQADQRRDHATAASLDRQLGRALLETGNASSLQIWELYRHAVVLQPRLEEILTGIGKLHPESGTLTETDQKLLEKLHDDLNAQQRAFAAILADAARIPIVGLTNCPEGTTLGNYLASSPAPASNRPLHGPPLVEWCACFYTQVACAIINVQRLQVKCAAAMARMLRENENQAPS